MWWNQRRKETWSWQTKADKQPGDDMKKDNDKSKSDKDKNEKDMTDKDQKRPRKNLKKIKSKILKFDDSKINKNLGSFPKGLITNAVRQKDIRDKIVGILKTQNFNLDVNYEKHEAKVTLSNGQVIIFTFKEEKKPEADKPADKQPGDDIKKDNDKNKLEKDKNKTDKTHTNKDSKEKSETDKTTDEPANGSSSKHNSAKNWSWKNKKT
ncbi:hypothetical protein HYD89_03880 [Mycoplasmopsis bovis]|nr:hypothetical protein [Mycoplasmopsis bovis]QQH36061.1 hypothetical protein HYD89_03880 [Mycoplasmopsis bovis]